MIRQESDNPFSSTYELYSYEGGRERSKKLAIDIIKTFRHAYDLERKAEKVKKEKKE